MATTKIDREIFEMDTAVIRRACAAMHPDSIGSGLTIHAAYVAIGTLLGLHDRQEAIDNIYQYGQTTPTGHILRNGKWVRPTRQEAGLLHDCAEPDRIAPSLARAIRRLPRRVARYSIPH